MSISETTRAAIQGDIAAIRAIRMSLELLLTSERFNTHDSRDEIAMAQTIAVFHRVERRIQYARNNPPSNISGDYDGTLDYNEALANVRHAAIETIDTMLKA